MIPKEVRDLLFGNLTLRCLQDTVDQGIVCPV